MKSLLVLSFFLCAFSCVAAERLTMTGPPAEEEAVKEILEKVSKSCSGRDFRGFMECFTEKKAASIRKCAENAFICGGVDVDVLDFFVISSEEDSVSFGVRYHWSQAKLEKVTYCSKMVIKKSGDSWRIDSEEVRSRTFSDGPSFSSFAANLPPQPAANQEQQPQAPRQQQQKDGWLINKGEVDLPLGAPYKPGGCSGGRCGVR